MLHRLSRHLSKFGEHRPCGSRDRKDRVFHVTLQGHMIKGPCDFMEGSSSLSIPTLPSLLVTDIVSVDIK